MTLPEAFAIAVQHHRAGRLGDAEQLYRQVLAVQPQHAEAVHLLGVLALQVGRLEDGVGLIRHAIALFPGASMFHSNLGFGLKELGRLDEAIAATRRALELDPRNGEAHNNLGVAFEALGRLEEAAAEFRTAAHLQGGSTHPHNNLGNALRNLGRPEEAVAHFREALRLDPQYAEAHCNLGTTLTDLGQFDEAIAAMRRAIELAPNLAVAHYNLGNALRDRGDGDEAHEEYRRALALNPDDHQCRHNLATLLKTWGAVDEALAEYRLIGDSAARPGGTIAGVTHSNLLFALHYCPAQEPGEIFAEHRRWSERYERPGAAPIPQHTNDPAPERRLRVGYVSPDFRGHSIAYFLEHLLQNHDPAQVELFCYDASARGDRVTERFRAIVPHWRPIQRLGAAEVAAQIRRDGIDILIDLAGHTANHRLDVFALKPAPVQASWLGYCDTTGLAAMDYRITDAIADPPGATEHLNTETLVRLPTCAWCFRPITEAPPVAPPPADAAGFITFGCFNALPKLTLPHLRVWAEILRRVPGSRLLLKSPALTATAAQARLRAQLDRAGIAPDRTVLLGNKYDLREHLATYGQVDIALDTFPYHGVTTTCEALWMGVPVVALAGSTHVSRVGASLLANAGLPELIARDGEEFVKIAVSLAADRARLAGLRATLREKMSASALMDAPRFAREMDEALRQMWRTWCAGAGSSAAP